MKKASIKQENQWEVALEILSLIAVMQYVAYRFLQSTMFSFSFTNIYKYATILFLTLTGGVRFLLLYTQKLKRMKTRTEKSRAILLSVLTGCLALPFIYVGMKHDYKVLVFYPLVAVCLYKMDYRRVFRWFVWTVGVLLIATIICCLSGTVRNIVSWWHDDVWCSYGIINTTDFASYFTFLLLFAWCSQKNRGWINTILIVLIGGLLTYIVYKLTDSKTSLYCGIIILLAIIWDCLSGFYLKSSKGNNFVKHIDGLTVFAFPIFASVFAILVFLYAKQYTRMENIDKLLTNRLSMMLTPLEKYGVHLFGVDMLSAHGAGATLIRNWSSGYGYLDVGYAMLIIKYGIVIFLIVMGFWMLTTFKALQAGEKRVTWAMAIIAFHALSEARFLDINYNILLFMPFCVFDCKAKKQEECQKQLYAVSRPNWTKPVSTILFCLIVYLLFPKIISWLRTIFSYNEWNIGVFAFRSLFVTAGLLILLVVFWIAINKVICNRNKKAIALFLSTIILLAGSIAIGNIVIEKERAEDADRMKAEKDVITLVQEAAVQPIYVAERSEIYKRSIGGFSDHVFSTEELIRTKGTIITDADVESLVILKTGGSYTPVSPWSGIYTYDPAVKEALLNAGYTWKSYYGTERSCNLSEVAERNGLRMENGHLLLKGAKNSVNENLEWDQYAGVYEVRYTVGLPTDIKLNGKDAVCNIIIQCEAGDRIIAQLTLFSTDFNENGWCTITIPYQIEDTPKVSYLIIAEDGVDLLVDEIAWHRVS